MTGLLNPDRRKWVPPFYMILVVYLGHGIFHPVQQFYFLPTKVLRLVLSSQMERILERKAVHFYRSTRQTPLPYQFHDVLPSAICVVNHSVGAVYDRRTLCAYPYSSRVNTR